TPDIPSTPDFLFITLSTSSKVKFSLALIYGTIAGSISPHLVPITNPANGVNPMLVAKDFPPFTPQILDPFPRWHVIMFNSSTDLSNICAAFNETYLWDVPWNPYLLIPCFS